METSQSISGPSKEAGNIDSQVHATHLVKSSGSILSMITMDPPTDPDERWQFVVNQFESLQKEINRLQIENTELKAGLASANGKISYLENQIGKVKVKIGEVEWKELQNDIVLYNVPEVQGKLESDIAIDILNNKLHIAQDCIHSQTNPTGNILMDNAFRIGKKLGEKPRPLVVVFNTQK